MRASGPKDGAEGVGTRGSGEGGGRSGEGARGSGEGGPPEPIPAPTPAADKAAWRTWAHGIRRAWAADPRRRSDDEAAVRARLAAWVPWGTARLALAYVAFGDELDPIGLGMHHAGDAAPAPALATTRTVGPGKPLQLHAWVEPFERHPFGFLQPRPDAPSVDPGAIDLILVPGLAFDVHGARLGHGQGHYDRLLPTLPGHVPRVGVTLDALVVGRLPTEPHDAPMTHLLTPGGIRGVGRR